MGLEIKLLITQSQIIKTDHNTNILVVTKEAYFKSKMNFFVKNIFFSPLLFVTICMCCFNLFVFLLLNLLVLWDHTSLLY